MTDSHEDLAILRQRALQFLVHSFLYYRLGESVISDSFYDQIVGELRELRRKSPEAEMPYQELIDPQLGTEDSGFRIRDYPPRIISSAFKLLYASTQPGMDFTEFVERRGYRARIHPEPGHEAEFEKIGDNGEGAG